MQIVEEYRFNSKTISETELLTINELIKRYEDENVWHTIIIGSLFIDNSPYRLRAVMGTEGKLFLADSQKEIKVELRPYTLKMRVYYNGNNTISKIRFKMKNVSDILLVS